jgi:hypothetical protein
MKLNATLTNFNGQGILMSHSRRDKNKECIYLTP